MSKEYERLKTCYNSIKSKIPFMPKIAVVLGSGLGEFENALHVSATISFAEIADFPDITQEDDEGAYVFAIIEEIPVVIVKSNLHFYEGYSMPDVVLPIRLLYMMGVRILVLTCAASGINYKFSPGDLMVVEDHISCFVPSPLIGENIDECGSRFCSMEDLYNKELRGILFDSAREFDIPIQRGVFLQTSGPEYETVSEIKMCRILGADAVGMSSACEAIAAKQMGMDVCSIACIINLSAGIIENALTYDDIKNAVNEMLPKLKTLLIESIGQMNYLTTL